MNHITTTRALTLCTSCNTAFTGPKCPTCGKSVDHIYSENEIKETLMKTVNKQFSTDFSLPSEVYCVTTKPMPVPESTYIRGLIGENNKIHGISGRFDTAVRLGQSGGYKGFFAWFLASKQEEFEGALSTDVSVDPFDTQTDASSLTVNLKNCISVAEADFLRQTPVLEDFLASLSWAMIHIFVPLAEKGYYFPIPSDDNVFVELKQDRVVCVKFVALNDPKKYLGDYETAERRNINLFCSYLYELFTRFCGKVKKNDQLADAPNISIEMFGNLFASAEISATEFEFSPTLYKLLMLIKAGKKISLSDGKSVQEVCTLKQFKAGIDSLRGAGFSQFPVDFPNRPNRHASQKVFSKTFDTSYVSIKSFEAKENSDIYFYSDDESDFLLTALFDATNSAEQAYHFTSRLSLCTKEYLQVKLFGGPSLSAKSKNVTPFYSKLKGKLKKGDVEFAETALLRQLVEELQEEIALLNSDADVEIFPSFSIVFVFKRESTLHVLEAHVGDTKLLTFDMEKNVGLSCTEKTKTIKEDDFELEDETVVYKTSKLSGEGCFILSTKSGANNLKKEEMAKILSANCSAKRSLYNMLFTTLLRGSSGNCTMFVLKPLTK